VQFGYQLISAFSCTCTGEVQELIEKTLSEQVKPDRNTAVIQPVHGNVDLTNDGW